MPPRLPTPTDFPPTLTLTITPPPPSTSTPSNALVLLHGLGDTHHPFTTLSQRLSLPETVCISLQAPTPLPFSLPGFHWGDDIIFDQRSGNMDIDTGFVKAVKMLTGVVEGLTKECGFRAREVLMFGYGQGGMAALAVVASLEEELAGVVTIGGPVPSSTMTSTSTSSTSTTPGPSTSTASSTSPPPTAKSKNRTPILALGGSSQTLLTPSAITNLKTVYEFVEYKKWPRAGDSMPRNREEMLPIMEFFSRRLRSRRGVPEGSVEIT